MNIGAKLATNLRRSNAYCNTLVSLYPPCRQFSFLSPTKLAATTNIFIDPSGKRRA